MMKTVRYCVSPKAARRGWIVRNVIADIANHPFKRNEGWGSYCAEFNTKREATEHKDSKNEELKKDRG